jgi:hypothetical protein
VSQALLSSYGYPSIICDSADFDGANDYMAKGSDLTGTSNGQSGIISIWCTVDAVPPTFNSWLLEHANAFTGGATRLSCGLTTAGKFEITASNSSGTTILSLTTNSTYSASGVWRHILCSWDLSTAGARSLYINDVDELSVTTFTDDTIKYTSGDWSIGCRTGGSVNYMFNGQIAEVYFAMNQYLDFSVEANRRKFISVGGKPVNLGTDGSLPTGTAAIMYHHLDDGEAAANFATNAGTGGNLSITGTLTTGASSPSD